MSDSSGSACPVCGASATGLFRDNVEDFEYFVQTRRPFSVYRCGNCTSEFLFPRPTEEEIRSFYPAHYHAYHNDHGAVARRLVAWRAKGRAQYYRNLVGADQGAIFDVGTGDCRHFDDLRHHCDFTFAGVEIKPEIAEQARAKGYDVVDGMLETMDMTGHEGRYDVVSMNHVIEHVLDPRLMATRALHLLKPGGKAVGQLPTNTAWEARLFARRWAGYHFPRHLQAFSREGLKRMLEEVGFVDVKIISVPHLQTALSVQNSLIAAGWRPKMSYGKVPLYSLILLLVAPFEVAALLGNHTGIIDFEATKPGA